MTSKEKKLLVRTRMISDRAWAAARNRKCEVDRIATNGPDGSEHDRLLCQANACLISGDLSLRSFLADHPEPD